MQTKLQTTSIPKTLTVIMVLAMLLMGGLSPASAQGAATVNSSLSAHVLSDGQFVYGPNVGTFEVKAYLEAYAPHLLNYADDLYERSKYNSINPKVFLTLLEIHSHTVSTPMSGSMEDSFGLKNGNFITQFDSLSASMANAYYLHIYNYSALPVSERVLKPFTTPGGITINVSPDTNAGTYAIIAGLAAMDEQNISMLLDNNQANGFYQTYIRLFGNDDPLDETNRINIPGEAGALAAPDNLLQFPWQRGKSWLFNGVHDIDGGTGFGSPLNDASAIDFFPAGVIDNWGSDTSNAWVVASASGIPTKVSECYFTILHGGGWETTYYHLENIQNYAGSINQNDKIGLIANTIPEALCDGGSSTGPHVHYTLNYNGALYAINGTPLSGWYVHAGTSNYDSDPSRMWLEKGGVKKYAYDDLMLSEGTIPTLFVDVYSGYWAQSYIERLYTAGITGGCITTPLQYCPDTSVTRAQMAVFLEKGLHGSSFTPPTATGTKFTDVPTSHWAAAWIEALAADGITSGCGNGNYCPDAEVTRAQMSVFLLKSAHGSTFTPPTASGTKFTDVSSTYWAAAWIEQLAAESITGGCGNNSYCPDQQVTRAQMAVFLIKTFNLP